MITYVADHGDITCYIQLLSSMIGTYTLVCNADIILLIFKHYFGLRWTNIMGHLLFQEKTDVHSSIDNDIRKMSSISIIRDIKYFSLQSLILM